ncbi:hypothetical protein V8E36_003857 [Tilletia maclaganii]
MTSTSRHDPYAVLGLDPSQADDARAIRQAYRRQALRWHPDRALPERKLECEQHFKEVARAFEILSDPALRTAYDQSVAQEQAQREYERAAHDRQHAAAHHLHQQPSWGLNAFNSPLQQQHLNQHHPFFSGTSLFGQHQNVHSHFGASPFGFPSSSSAAAHPFGPAGRPAADPFRMFDDFFASDPVFAQHARMMDDFHTRAFGGEARSSPQQQQHPIDSFFRSFEDEHEDARVEQQRARARERARQRRETAESHNRSSAQAEHDLSPSQPSRQSMSRVAQTQDGDDLGSLFARVGGALFSGLVDLAFRGQDQSLTPQSAERADGSSSFQSSFTSFSSSSSRTGNGGAMVSQSEETRIVNGRRQTVRRRVDGQGNETVEVIDNDGRRSITVNGVPQSLPSSARQSCSIAQ